MIKVSRAKAEYMVLRRKHEEYCVEQQNKIKLSVDEVYYLGSKSDKRGGM